MPIFLILILILLIIILISQFGAKLNAKSSFTWWLIFGFLLFSTVYPAGLLPLAHLLGIQLVSNMVMAGLLVLLMFLSIQENVISTQLQRKLRDSVTSDAASEFIQKFQNQTSSRKRVLVAFPAFNEEGSLPGVLESLSRFKYDSEFDLTFLFVNDGSKDRTEQILSGSSAVHFVSHSTNVGVAGVMLTAFKILNRLDFDSVVQCDADGQHPIDQIPALLKCAAQERADLTIGSRYLSQGAFERHESSSLTRRVGSALISSVLKLFSSTARVTDPTSGFRVYSAQAARFLSRNMPDDYPEPESVGLLLLAGKKVVETEVSMKPRTAGESSLGGLNGAQFMIKVITALLGLRLRGMGNK
jgi:hypothetical protein